MDRRLKMKKISPAWSRLHEEMISLLLTARGHRTGAPPAVSEMGPSVPSWLASALADLSKKREKERRETSHFSEKLLKLFFGNISSGFTRHLASGQKIKF